VYLFTGEVNAERRYYNMVSLGEAIPLTIACSASYLTLVMNSFKLVVLYPGAWPTDGVSIFSAE
jgi:hypothetical protein